MFFLYFKNSSTLGLYLFVSFLALWSWNAGLSPSTCHLWETHGGRSCALSRCPWGWQSPVASLGDPCRTSTSLPVNLLFLLVLLSVFHPHRRQFPRSTPSSAPFRNLLLAVSLSISSSHTSSPFLRACPASASLWKQAAAAPSSSFSLFILWEIPCPHAPFSHSLVITSVFSALLPRWSCIFVSASHLLVREISC